MLTSSWEVSSYLILVLLTNSAYTSIKLCSSMWGGYGDTFLIVPMLTKETVRIWCYGYHASHRMMDSNDTQLILCGISVSRVPQSVICLLMYCFLLLFSLKSFNSLHERRKGTWGMLIFSSSDLGKSHHPQKPILPQSINDYRVKL